MPTAREAATEALKAGLVRKLDVIPDDLHGYRVQVWFRETEGGPEYCYESKPFDGDSLAEVKAEAAKRLKRIGATEAQIKTATKHL